MNVNTYPLVSIVTPAFNQAQYLTDTIESILAQDYPNIEYIVLDDGSTDHTRDILKLYDGKIRWESHENIGQASTLNKGWAMSRGEILAYLSSDDCLTPNAVSLAVKALNDRPDVIVTYSDYFLMSNTKDIIRAFQAPDFDRHALIENLVCHPGPGAFFRREIFEKLGGWNPNLRQIPDFEFWLRASEYGDFLRLPENLAYSRIHESSQSFAKTSIERSEEPVRVVKDFWQKNSVKLGLFNKNYSFANSYLLAARMHLISGRLIKGVSSLCRSVRYKPKMLFSTRFWRMVAVALVRNVYYSFFLKK